MALAISFAKVDITPTPGANPYLGGYGGNGARQATGTFSPLYARCLVLWNDSHPNAIVSVDVLGIARSMHQTIRSRVVPLNGAWSTADFMLAATHTHNGPVLVDRPDPYLTYGMTDLTPVQQYSAWLQDQIVNLVQAALNATKTTVTLDYRVVTQNFSVNREGLSYVETAVPVLVARRSDSLPAAVLFSYGTHPVCAGAQDKWDGDYPAVACAVVEAAIPGCFAMYIQGPSGDQDPTGARNWGLRNKLGAQLGSAVVGATTTAGRTLTGPITTSYREIDLPLDITNTPGNLAAVRAVYQTRLSNPLGQPVWYQRHAQTMIQRIDNNNIGTSVSLPLQVWKLQGSPILRIAMTGGELVAGYATYFRSRYGGTNGLIIGGYANETPGYIPSNELLPPIDTNGSYAGGWDTDFPGIAGGAWTVYGEMGHFKAGTGGAEDVLISALNSMLA